MSKYNSKIEKSFIDFEEEFKKLQFFKPKVDKCRNCEEEILNLKNIIRVL